MQTQKKNVNAKEKTQPINQNASDTFATEKKTFPLVLVARNKMLSRRTKTTNLTAESEANSQLPNTIVI